MPDGDKSRFSDLKRETSGTLVVVVGPSGVGKDSLMALARQHFKDEAGIRFVQRVITRSAESGGEDHLAASAQEFAAMRAKGAFAIDWQAHGLSYGVPVAVLADLKAGVSLVVNGSRSALPHFEAVFPKLMVVNVTARPDVLAARLAARGRETAADIEARLNRTAEAPPAGAHVVTIDNSGALEKAAQDLINLLQSFRREPA